MRDYGKIDREIFLRGDPIEKPRASTWIMIGIVIGIVLMLAAWDYRDRTMMGRKVEECWLRYGASGVVAYDPASRLFGCRRAL